jgi:hypothetical protein
LLKPQVPSPGPFCDQPIPTPASPVAVVGIGVRVSYASDSWKLGFRHSVLSETHGGEGHELAEQAGTKNPARRQRQRAGQGISLLRRYISSLALGLGYCQAQLCRRASS